MVTSAQTPIPAATPPAPVTTAKPATNALTKDEKAQITKARHGVLAANPDLKGEDDALKIQAKDLQAKGAAATPEEKAALKTANQAHEQKMRAAMVAFDPALGPVFAKMDAAKPAKK